MNSIHTSGNRTPGNRTAAALALAGGVLAVGFLASRRGEDLAGRIVLIMGGSRGLGLALAQHLAIIGCRVAICGRDQASLDSARRAIRRASSQDCLTIAADVTIPEQVEHAISTVRSECGQIDILINNAGVISVGPLSHMNLDDFHQALDVMFWGMVRPTLLVLPSMLERRCGNIVNITSIGGMVSVPHLLPYCSAKFAAYGFSEGLSAELTNTGVHVTTVAPGLMRTGSFLAAEFKGNPEQESTWFSLSSSLPGLTISADRAASRIVKAIERNRRLLILSTPANVLARLHGMFPSLSGTLVGAAGTLLPRAKAQASTRRGAEIDKPAWVRSMLTLGRDAAKRLQPQLSGSPAVQPPG